MHGKNQDGGMVYLPTDILDQICSRKSGHAQIEDNNIKLFMPQQGNDLIAISGFGRHDDVVGQHEQLLEPFAYKGVVVGKKNMDGCHADDRQTYQFNVPPQRLSERTI